MVFPRQVPTLLRQACLLARCALLVAAAAGFACTSAGNSVSIPDFHATIHAALGINPGHELLDGARPVPITDGGRPTAGLLA